jgi:hypothetical protein
MSSCDKAFGRLVAAPACFRANVNLDKVLGGV